MNPVGSDISNRAGLPSKGNSFDGVVPFSQPLLLPASSYQPQLPYAKAQNGKALQALPLPKAASHQPLLHGQAEAMARSASSTKLPAKAEAGSTAVTGPQPGQIVFQGIAAKALPVQRSLESQLQTSNTRHAFKPEVQVLAQLHLQTAQKEKPHRTQQQQQLEGLHSQLQHHQQQPQEQQGQTLQQQRHLQDELQQQPQPQQIFQPAERNPQQVMDARNHMLHEHGKDSWKPTLQKQGSLDELPESKTRDGRPKPLALETASLTKPPLKLPPKLEAEFEDDSEALGEGAFAVVRRLRRKGSGEIVALKVVEKYPLHIRNMLPQLQREVRIQGSLQHQHILRLLSYMEDESYVYMLLEHCPGGSLRCLCGKQPSNRLPEATSGRYFAQILKGVDFMHQHGYVHRDLKEENMLLTKEDEVRICDFGWSAEVQIEKALHTTCGTPHYWSPEIFEGRQQDTAVDLWALGTLVYELLVGHAPFWGTVEEIREKVLAVDLRYPPNLLSNEAIQLFYCLLQKEPRCRVPANQLLSEHPWVRRGLGASRAGSLVKSGESPFTPGPHEGSREAVAALQEVPISSVKGPVIAPVIRPPEGSRRSAPPLSAALPPSAPAHSQSTDSESQVFLNATAPEKLPTLPSLLLPQPASSLPPPRALQPTQQLAFTGGSAAFGTAR